MQRPLRSAAVLGAGTMGAQLAAHLANAGLPVRLLDVTAEAARTGLGRASQLLPDPFFVPDAATLITTGSLDDLSPLASADWIIEAVVERLDVKRALMARVEAARAPGAIVSSNTSGISLAAIAEGRCAEFQRHFLGTHFFNPPRYLHLVEIVPVTGTDPDVTARMSDFIDRRLGKGVVLAKDTPAFIANHLGVHGVVRILEAVAAGRITIEEVDAITGPAIGRPKSATFRTIDLAGLDILAHVADDLAARLPGADGRAFVLPAFVQRMIERGLLGDKTGQGFYKKVKDGGGSKILTLDLATLEYREREVPSLPALEAARTSDLAARLRALFLGNDRVGAFLRDTLGATLLYAARAWPGMAYSIDDVDRAMRWGFGWELGPFETWDAIGPGAVLEACGAAEPPAFIAAHRDRIRAQGLPPAQPDFLMLQTARSRGGVVKTTAGASLIDLGDDVLGLELHSKMNTIGAGTIEMLHAGVAEASARFAALVIGSEAANFSAGADLLLLARAADEGRWADIDEMVRGFQRATMALKTCAVPVVVAPGGLALGGGCEICLHGDRVQAAAETYLGLVEVGVGLIPAGGGTKEMLIRASAAAGGGDERRAVERVFQTLGFGRTSTSAPGARRLGYLRDVDGITMNRDRLVADAKRLALTRARDGYQAPVPRTAVRVGGADAYAALALGVHLAWRAGRISDHDARIGRALAGVLTGGPTAHATMVSEKYLLDLEREAFLSLCGEPKTIDRIRYTLKTGKTLRN